MGNLSSKFFDIDGKITRKQFILRYIVLVVYIIILGVMRDIYNEVILELLRSGNEINSTLLTITSLVLFILAILGLVALVSVQMRRLNDLKKPKGLIILTFIPLINIVYLLYLCIAPSKQDSNIVTPKKETTEEEIIYIDNQDNLDEIVEFKHASNNGSNSNEHFDNVKNKEPAEKFMSKIADKKVPILIILILLLGVVYKNFFYFPHNGRWESELYSRKIILEVDRGEGIFKIGNRKGLDVLIFEPNKKNTAIGINGSSNRIVVNRGVLIIELNDLYTTELGDLNEVLYFKKK